MEFKCRYCKEYFSSYAKRWMHINSAHLHCVYICTVCNRSFNSAPPAYQHAVRVHERQKKIIKRISRASAEDEGDDGVEDGVDGTLEGVLEGDPDSSQRKRKRFNPGSEKSTGSEEGSTDAETHEATDNPDSPPPPPPAPPSTPSTPTPAPVPVSVGLSCQFCDKQFYSTWNLNRHMTLLHSNPPPKRSPTGGGVVAAHSGGVDPSHYRGVDESRSGVDMSQSRGLEMSRYRGLDARSERETPGRSGSVDLSRSGSVGMSPSGNLDLSRSGNVDMTRSGGIDMTRPMGYDLTRSCYPVETPPTGVDLTRSSEASRRLGEDDAFDSREDEVIRCKFCNIDCFGPQAHENHMRYKHEELLGGGREREREISESEEKRMEEGKENGEGETEDNQEEYEEGDETEDSASHREARALQFRKRYVWVGNKVMCTSCDKYLTYANWHGHEDSIHLNKSYDCQKCGKTLKWRKNRVRHEDVCTGKPEDGKPETDESSPEKSENSRSRHKSDMESSHVEDSNQNAIQSERPVPPPESFVDDDDDESKEADLAAKNERMKEYINVVETPEKKSWVCTKCHVEYNSRGGLVAHVHRRHFHTVFKCHTCAKAFNYLTDLNRHVREGPCSRFTRRGRPSASRGDKPRMIPENYTDPYQDVYPPIVESIRPSVNAPIVDGAVRRSLNDEENWKDDSPDAETPMDVAYQDTSTSTDMARIEVSDAIVDVDDRRVASPYDRSSYRQDVHHPHSHHPAPHHHSQLHHSHFGYGHAPSCPAAAYCYDSQPEGRVEFIQSVAVVPQDLSTTSRLPYDAATNGYAPVTTAPPHPPLTVARHSRENGEAIAPDVLLRDAPSFGAPVAVKVEVDADEDGSGAKVLKSQCHFCSVYLVHGTEDHKRHLLEHLEEYYCKTVCPQCMTQCNSNKAMSDHFLMVHGKLKKLLCEEANCVKTFWLRKQMERHRNNHKAISAEQS